MNRRQYHYEELDEDGRIPFTERISLKPEKRDKPFALSIAEPDTLVDSMKDMFSEYLREGNPVDVVCDLVGISIQLFNSWYKRGEVYETQVPLGEQRDSDEKYYMFMIEIRKAKATWMRERVVRLGKVQSPYWQKDLALLERRDRLNWGKDMRETRPEDYVPDESFL